ncbi:MAG: hyperosmotically inducible protein [Planctomycetota bacterium]|nr:MAG: hyperosmotically inducible protein [Planctomycetota bacterium]
MKTTMYFLAAAAAVAFGGCAEDKTPTQAQREADHEAREHEADDTGRNARDREGATVTPFDQGENETDRQITQEIRQAITGDDTMSANARNVKVVTSNGVVTLRGPVEDTEEKAAVERKAKSVDGVARVNSHLETVRR